jgi:hypothetical protein
MDISSLGEFVSARDEGGAKANYLQISLPLSYKQLISRPQHFANVVLSVNDCEWSEWISEKRSHIEHIYPLLSTQIEAVVSDDT